MISLDDEIRDTSRRRILLALRESPKTVSQIVAATGLKQPNVSNHLGRLSTRGIVKFQRSGKYITYEFASKEILAILESLVVAPLADASEIEYGPLCDRLWKSAIQGDEDACGAVLDEAFSHQASLLDIYDRLLAPSMRRVGTAYGEQTIDEAQEHMASEIVLRLMARTVRVPGPPILNGKSCVLGCVPLDYHTIGARMAADYLKLSGWKTLFCGGNVPVRSFLTTVFQNKPDLAIVSCAIESGRNSAERLIRELNLLRKDSWPFVIGIGGSLPPSERNRFVKAGADFACSDLRHFALNIVPEIQRNGTVPLDMAWSA